MAKKPEEIEIRVSSRILRHISRGIYRSPAGALKELVSNSYDAGAPKVTINTGYPVADRITVTDNGRGMSASDFRRIVSQIGFSNKTLGDEVSVERSKAKRKTIGHYGIGFLAIGQLTAKAIITSKTSGSTKGIRATLDFEQFEKHKVAGKDNYTIKDERSLELKDRHTQKLGSKADVKLPIGVCYLEEVQFETEARKESFTKVELIEIRSEVRSQILNLSTIKLDSSAEDQKRYSATFKDVLALLREKEQQSAAIRIKDRNIPRLREYFYEKLLWELAVYAPLRYPEMPVFSHKTGDLHNFFEMAKELEFELVVDGFILYKPYEQQFWESKPFEPKVFRWINEKYYKNYHVSGFVVFQPGTMIRPKSMQGILVRENGVAVGLYDPTFLRYPFNEGAKFNSLTGEIFAEGLSGAMNVDRDSFNETAEEYMALNEWLHGKLYNEVFTYIQKFQQKAQSPSRSRNERVVSEVLHHIADTGKKIRKIKLEALGRKNKPRVLVRGSTLVINTDHKDCDMSSAKREKLLFANALIIRGYITPEVYEEVSDEIEKTKREVRNR